jgi:hypothetical protein
MLKDSDKRAFLCSDGAGRLSWRKEFIPEAATLKGASKELQKASEMPQTKCVSKMSKEAQQKTLTKANKVVVRCKQLKQDTKMTIFPCCGLVG